MQNTIGKHYVSEEMKQQISWLTQLSQRKRQALDHADIISAVRKADQTKYFNINCELTSLLRMKEIGG